MEQEQARTNRAAAKKLYYQINRERIRAEQKLYREVNREEIARRDSERKKRARADDPEKYRERNRAWSAANKEKVRAKTDRWMQINSERKRETNRAWKLRNAEKAKKQNQEWWTNNKDRACEYARNRRATPRGLLEGRIRAGIYSRLNREVGRKGSARTFELLGYTVEELVAHLERQFMQRMSWENYGKWHVDHILPVSGFEYETFQDAEFKAAWALTNLRPMWASDNLRKGAKRLTLL